MSTNFRPLSAGDIVQYRKVGTFRVLSRVAGLDLNSYGGCWFHCEPVKAPKKYREAHVEYGGTKLYVSPANRVTDTKET